MTWGLINLVVFLYCINAFDPHFGFALKEKEFGNLEDSKHNAIKMESHLSGFGKIDPLGNSWLVTQKPKEKVNPSTHVKSPIDPIVILTHKINEVA